MKRKIILIGTSTGGPGHLKKILSSLSTSFKIPIVIAQHMNAVFIKSFVKQFNDELPFDVVMADDKHCIEDKTIYICASHCEVQKDGYALNLVHNEKVQSHYNPSVNHLFSSAKILTHDYDILAILLTGIGQDGALGLAELQDVGATCIAESKESAIVYGMPKKAAELNSQIKVLNLDSIINSIQQFGNINTDRSL